jgi:hypothetical protein
MGAKEAIYVDILAMKGTVEETMVTQWSNFKEDSLAQAETSKEKEVFERKKRSYILQSLRMVRGVVSTKTVLERSTSPDLRTNSTVSQSQDLKHKT